MQSDKDKIKDIFSSKLSGFKPEVDEELWARIARDLPANEVVSYSAKVSLIKRIIAVSGSVAAIFILLFIFVLSDRKDSAKQLSDNFPIEVLAPSVTNDSKFPARAEESGNKSHTVNGGTKLIAYSKQALSEKPVDVATFFSERENEGEEKETYSHNENSDAERNEEQDILNKALLDARIKEFANQGKIDEVLSEEITSGKEKKFTLSIGGNTSFSTNEERVSVPNSLRTMNVYYNEEMQALGDIDPAATRNVAADIDHNQPVSFGITVSKDLNRKFSLETGLVYTYLSSKIKSKRSFPVERNDTQHFHYLGIPVSVNYNFAEWGKADFYVSAGVMAQKDFHGRYKEYQVSFDKDGKESQIENKKEIHQNNLQFSASGKIGATYPIYKKMHAYATVGGAYYFDASNKYKTIYSDKEFQLDINLGVKFKF